MTNATNSRKGSEIEMPISTPIVSSYSYYRLAMSTTLNVCLDTLIQNVSIYLVQKVGPNQGFCKFLIFKQN